MSSMSYWSVTVTPEFPLTWYLGSMVEETMGGHAPVLDEILRSATQSDRALRESRVKDTVTEWYLPQRCP